MYLRLQWNMHCVTLPLASSNILCMLHLDNVSSVHCCVQMSVREWLGLHKGCTDLHGTQCKNDDFIKSAVVLWYITLVVCFLFSYFTYYYFKMKPWLNFRCQSWVASERRQPELLLCSMWACLSLYKEGLYDRLTS